MPSRPYLFLAFLKGWDISASTIRPAPTWPFFGFSRMVGCPGVNCRTHPSRETRWGRLAENSSFPLCVPFRNAWPKGWTSGILTLLHRGGVPANISCRPILFVLKRDQGISLMLIVMFRQISFLSLLYKIPPFLEIFVKYKFRHLLYVCWCFQQVLAFWDDGLDKLDVIGLARRRK